MTIAWESHKRGHGGIILGELAGDLDSIHEEDEGDGMEEPMSSKKWR